MLCFKTAALICYFAEKSEARAGARPEIPGDNEELSEEICDSGELLGRSG